MLQNLDFQDGAGSIMYECCSSDGQRFPPQESIMINRDRTMPYNGLV